ncbi:serine protease Do [Rhodobium orientis]|nr:serine protease Do [Rhodobium orientis]
MGLISIDVAGKAVRTAVVAALLATGGAGVAMAQTAEPDSSASAARPAMPMRHGPDSVADLAERLLDAVVNVSTTQIVADKRSVKPPKLPEGSPFQEFFEDFFNRRGRRNEPNGGVPRRVQSLGSGFVVDGENGIIVTNNHVIDKADEIVINFNDGTKLTAELLGTDSKTDLAVLKVKPVKPLKSVKFGDSQKIRVGDWVMAIGNPFNLGGTVTVGIVSARNRDIRSGPYDDYIQTDAAINRGNSGGPLFNMYGDVVGINTAIISPSGGSIGIGFAIPSEIAMRVINQLRQYGETRRGWLGVRIQQVNDDIADSLGLDEAYGALVAGVTPDGPAAKGGIQPGDLILEFDGRKVDSMRELPRMVAETEISKDVAVRVLRKGKEMTLAITLGRLEDFENGNKEDEQVEEEQEPEVAQTGEALGMVLAELDPALRAQFKIDDSVTGVVVTEVDPVSPAAEKRVQAGDVIVEVAQEAVATPADVEARIKELADDGRRSVLLLLSNGTGELRFVAVRFDEIAEPEDDKEPAQ